MLKTREEVQRDFNARKLQSQTNRRKYMEGCKTCVDIKEKHDGFGPPHDASPRCRSGFYEHCTCDEACF